MLNPFIVGAVMGAILGTILYLTFPPQEVAMMIQCKAGYVPACWGESR